MPSPNKHPQLFSRGRRQEHGFSLLELLVVVACVGVLMGLSVPAFSSIGRGASTSKSATDIAAILELARTHAKASNTRVEVGFSSDALGLQMVVISAREGTSITQVSRVHRFPLVRLASVAESGRPSADLTLAEARPALLPSFQLGGKTFDRVIEFNSRGEARALLSGLTRCIEIGLLPNVDGTTPAALLSNFGAVQVAGLSGGVAVFRP